MQWLALACRSPEPVAATEVARMGWWGLRFTPRVVALDADTWGLEVSTTLRLWGGLVPLVQRLHACVQPAEAGPVCVTAGPSARAALARMRWLRQGGAPPGLVPWADAPGLADLPLWTLDAARPHVPVLARLGVHTWGHLRRLPRAGVARRWGQDLLDALDQAWGLAPEHHRWWTPAEQFEQVLECPQALTQASELLHPATHLMQALCRWLAERHRGVLAWQWTWLHDRRRNVPASGTQVLRTARPTQDSAHLLRLSQEHWARMPWAAPVLQLGLQTLEHATHAPVQPDWLAGAAAPPGALDAGQLVERLVARLGPQAVHRLNPRNEHRPEHLQATAPATGSPGTWPPPMVAEGLAAWSPSWLLACAVPLAVRGHRPCLDGRPLALLVGPHRFEATPWPGDGGDGCDVAPPALCRDYFVAQHPWRGLLWVFRQPPSDTPGPQWFWHGVFA
jgi:protein ImuB